MGLRSLFCLLAGLVDRLRYFKPGLASVLVFLGAKMTAVEVVEAPAPLSLRVIALLLGAAVAAS